jgi:4-amino-4-deoxy-L-arabinose transferase-like glycosyltransferase
VSAPTDTSPFRPVEAAAKPPVARDHERTRARRVPVVVTLGSLVALITLLDVWWRTRETRPPHWDMAHHLTNSLFYEHAFSLTHPFAFLARYAYYPPLPYWITDVFYGVLGNEAIWVAVLSNVVWLTVLVFATYGIGSRLWNPRVGWLSVVFVVTVPMAVSTFKDYMLDAPLTAVSALALYLLIRGNGFASRRISLLFGLTCGCGLLVKWTLPLVVALPVLHALATALSEARLRRRFDHLGNAAIAAGAMLAVCGLWYVHNFVKIVSTLIYYNGPEGIARKDPPVASLASALWYLWNLLNTQLYLIPALFVLAGIVFSSRKHELARRNVYPILMAAGTYLMFSLLRHKDPRYTMPMLPALAIIATSWLEYVSARVRTYAAAFLVVWGAVVFLAITFGTSLLPRSLILSVPGTSFGPSKVVAFDQQGYLTGPPTHEQWHEEDVIRAMARVPGSSRTFAYEGPDTVWFNMLGLEYYAARHCPDCVAKPSRPQFLVSRGANPTAPGGFVVVRRWVLPDGGRVALSERS